jgi:hypothetical protein
MRHSLIILALLSGSIAVRGAAAAGPGATEVEERLAKDIPADFDSFVKRFENPVRRPTLILIPDGRSLAKKKAGFSDPRILPLLSNGFGGPADTFMAFTPRNHQMEMISWNPGQGRYEFYIVENLGNGKTPKLTQPPRNLCLSCHQHGGPIFSRAPWSETNAPFLSSFGGGKVAKELQEKSQFKSSFPIADETTVFSYDGFVRIASGRLQMQKICRELCAASDNDCRLRLLSSALLRLETPAFSLQGPPPDDYFQNTLWPRIVQNGFGYPSSVIPDRDPMLSREKGGTTVIPRGENLTFTETMVGGRFDKPRTGSARDALFSEKGAKLPIERVLSKPDDPWTKSKGNVQWTEVYGIQEEADPLSPRPYERVRAEDRDSILFHVAQECFGLSSFLPSGTAGPDPFSKLKKSPHVDLLLKNWPPQAELIAKVLAGSDAAIAGPVCEDQTPRLVLPQEPSLQQIHKKLSDTTQGPLAVFRKHCSECHAGAGADASGITLPLNDATALSNYRKDSQGQNLILKSLKSKDKGERMPPDNSGHSLSEDDRTLLIRFLEE